MNTNQNLPIFAAVGPNGEIIKTSVSVFAAEAKRWASKRKGYTVQSIGTVPPTFVAKRGPGRPRKIEAVATVKEAAVTAKRGPGRPRKIVTEAAVKSAPESPKMNRRELLGKKHMDFLKNRLAEIEAAVQANKKPKASAKLSAAKAAPAPATNQ